MNYHHTPVMLKEVLGYLDPQPGQHFIDCTLGGAGHTIAIAKRVGKTGKVLAIDLDKLAIDNAKILIKKHKYKNIILANDNFKNLSKIVSALTSSTPLAKQESGVEEAVNFNGIIFDLGLSSAQLKDRSRGFSFQSDAPLDMAFGCRMSDVGCQNTEYIINNWKQIKLEKIIKEYGEERFARGISQGIVDYRKLRPIKTTRQLVEIIKSAVPKKYLYSRPRNSFGRAGKIHPATRTFQALRIATNNELENLREALPQTVDLLNKAGRIVVISYHSLEDRIVKQFFKTEVRDCICPPSCPACRCQHKARIKILTKKIIRPTKEEVLNNPRARSAKLRAAERI